MKGVSVKKYFTGLCLGILVLGMTACGSKDNQNSSQSTETQESQSTESESSGAASDVQESPAQSGQPEGGISDAEFLETEGGWSTEMQQIKDAITAELGEDYFPDMQVPQENLEILIGITSDMYEDYLFEMPMISVNVDTLLIIKAKEDKASDVESAVKAYQLDLQQNSRPYPMNLGKIQASGVETIGNYVCFVQLGGDTDDLFESGDDEAVIKHCQEQNEQVLKLIREQVAAQ